MATAEISYQGELRTKAIHLRSGVQIITDAPPDNQGKGEAFSPTDLVAAALVSCMMTVMGIAARTHNIQLVGLRGEVTKIMAASPRRISALQVHLYFSGPYNAHERTLLERTAKTCPVALSLHPDLEQSVTLHFDD